MSPVRGDSCHAGEGNPAQRCLCEDSGGSGDRQVPVIRGYAIRGILFALDQHMRRSRSLVRTLSALLILLAGISSGEARIHLRRPRPAIDAASLVSADGVPVTGPKSPAAAILRAQILLDRARFSSGEIDGIYGSNFGRSVQAFKRSHGLPANKLVDAATWKVLDQDSQELLVGYRVEESDVSRSFAAIPSSMSEKAKLAALDYQSPLEGLAEKFHCSPALLKLLNPSAGFRKAGEKLTVPNVTRPPAERAASIVVSKSDLSVSAIGADGKLLGRFVASIGSRHDPLPIGEWKILGVARNPVYNFNPKLFWDADPSDTKAVLAPGPNNPVGVVWIDLSREHYGIHGTPEPSLIGKTYSHGCIRLTNWDAWDLAQMVRPGTRALLQK